MGRGYSGTTPFLRLESPGMPVLALGLLPRRGPVTGSYLVQLDRLGSISLRNLTHLRVGLRREGLPANPTNCPLESAILTNSITSNAGLSVPLITSSKGSSTVYKTVSASNRLQVRNP